MTSGAPRPRLSDGEPTAAEARLELQATRRRLTQALQDLQHDAPLPSSWRAVVLQRPVLAVGGAFLVGWAVARLLTSLEKGLARP
jgi:hypothetical protein